MDVFTSMGPTLPKGGVGGAGGGVGVISLPGIENILFVDKGAATGAEDGTQQHPFHVIQDAIDAANLLAGAADPYLVFVYPGIYDEALTLSTDYVYLAGANRDTTIVYNDAANVLTITSDKTSIWNITISAASTRRPVIMWTAATTSVLFNSVLIIGATADNFVDLAFGGKLRFVDCEFKNEGRTILLTFTATSEIEIVGCIIDGNIRHRQGSLLIRETSIYTGVANAILMDTASADLIAINNNIESTFNSGIVINFVPGDLILQNNYIAANASAYAVGAGVAVTGAVIEGNVLGTGFGIDGDISHVTPTRYVGSAGMEDWYATTQDALDSCTFAGITVHLRKDETLTASLTWTNTYSVTIDGNGHDLSYAGNLILSFGGGAFGGREVTIRDTSMFGYFSVSVSDNHAQKLILVDCVIVGSVTSRFGNQMETHIRHCEINGFDAALRRSPVYFGSSSDSMVRVEHSYLKGFAGNPAVYWDTVTNDNLEIKYSTIWHGSGAANNPFGRSAAQTPDYHSYESAYNSDPEAGGIWTNLIAPGQRFDSLDVQTDY